LFCTDSAIMVKISVCLCLKIMILTLLHYCVLQLFGVITFT